MPYKERTFQCETCKVDVVRRKPEGATVYCINHAIDKMIAQGVDMHNKRGDGYTRWLNGLAAAVRREQERMGTRGTDISS